ncbi:MAG: reverse transcriptase domain-containing protein [Candidatus Kaiserbacteria bacterium]|nr:reverse transcriptase domain-containing protein [Candidatus Kaiserbacteria bacterium]
MFFQDMLASLPQEPNFNFFSFSDVNPVSGRTKQRTVAAPNESMKILQRRFVKYLRSDENGAVRKKFLRYAMSSNPGDSPLKNVQRHRHNRYFYLVDFSNAYKSVGADKLVNVLMQLSTFRSVLPEELHAFLTTYFLDKKWGLIPGGNASQDLFNLYAGALVDVPLGEIAEEHGIIYTRYIDDLTFSSISPISEKMRRNIRGPILQAGFSINHRKCECVDLKKKTTLITGIGIADGGRLFVPRPYVRKIRGLIHHALTKKDVDMRRITGMVQILYQLHYEQNTYSALEQKVFKEFNALRKVKGIF